MNEVSPPDEVDPHPPVGGQGVLVIDIGDGSPQAKTLTPPTDIVSYVIDGTLDGGGDSFTNTVSAGESIVQSGLAPGLWTITVGAINENGIRIGEGTNTAEIYAGSVTTVPITITPLAGNGTLDLTIRWDKKAADEIEVTFIPEVTPSGELPFTIKTHADLRIGTYTNSEIPAGYYLLTLRLKGKGVYVWGIAEAVRILDGETTEETYDYPPN